MKTILFISHDDTITGAPILLMNLMELVKERKDYKIVVLVKNGYGILLNDFRVKFPTYVYNDFAIDEIRQNVFKRFMNRFFFKKNDFCITQVQNLIEQSDYIFSNTITNGDLFRKVTIPNHCKVITYVHELKMGIDFFTNKDDVNWVLNRTNIFAVPSQAVKNCLESEFHLKENQISIINYVYPNYRKNLESDILDAVGNDANLTVGLIGTLDWRKGSELLVILLKYYFTKYPQDQVYFQWKGVEEESVELKLIKYELSAIGLLDRIKFIIKSKDVSSFYKEIDLHLLLSKEDPYPLVVLEAASYGVPTICFEKAGGAMEFVEDDSGAVVSFLDLEQLSIAIHGYYLNRNRIVIQGRMAREKFKNRHCDVDLIYSQFENALNK